MSQDDEVRRLLADARHTEPIPPDVAERLDGVLADLGAERPVRPVVADLDAARRRRRVRTLLVAAAAVVAVGIGVDQLRPTTGSDGASGDSASSAEAGSQAGSAQDSAGGAASDELKASGPRASAANGPAVPSPTRPVRLTQARFAQQVRALQRDQVSLADLRSDGGADYSLAGVPCEPKVGPGRIVAAQYDGGDAVLVFRPVRGDSQVVDLYLCTGTDPVRSITLPAR